LLFPHPKRNWGPAKKNLYSGNTSTIFFIFGVFTAEPKDILDWALFAQGLGWQESCGGAISKRGPTTQGCTLKGKKKNKNPLFGGKKKPSLLKGTAFFPFVGA